jgi:HK97 family phage portal protein
MEQHEKLFPWQSRATKQQEKRSNPLDNPSNSLSLTGGWEWLFSGGRETDAGELINDQTALKSTVYACVRVLSESVASLPIRLLRVTPQGRVQEIQDPLYHLLAIAPNSEMTSFLFFETITFHLSLTGNSYSEIERSADGTPLALWPLNPRLTRAIRLPNGDLAYQTQDGEVGGSNRVIQAANMLHVPLMSYDGIVGLSPIQQAARALGLAAGAEKYGSRIFANGAVPMVAIKTNAKVKPEDKTKMRADWESLQTGSNQHRVAILDQDTSIEKLGITPEESQFLQPACISALTSVQFSECLSTWQAQNRNSAIPM